MLCLYCLICATLQYLIKNTLHNTIVGEYCSKIVFDVALCMLFSEK